MNSSTQQIAPESLLGNAGVLRCFIIGRTSLAVYCADLLRSRGHAVLGIVTDDSSVRQWAEERSIECTDPSHDFHAILSEQPVDVLLSVANPAVLPSSLLSLPKKLAINYHDAPLPRYAGVHATSWAILNGERVHGVTWHVMEERVDTGDILARELVEISDSDTAFSLNTKCFEAAVRCFGRLVEDLEAGNVNRIRQDPAARTFFGRYKRPRAAGIIDWNKRASEVAALVRALDFGPYDNALGTAKIATSAGLLVIRSVAPAEGLVQASPGTVTQTSAAGVTVATADGGIVLTRASTVEGEDVPIEKLGAYGVFEGAVLPGIEDGRIARIVNDYSRASRAEAFWLQRLRQVESPEIAYVRPVGDLTPGKSTTRELASLAVPSWLEPEERAAWLTTAFAAYLLRVSEGERISIGVRWAESSESDILADSVPLTVSASSQTLVKDFFVQSDAEQVALRQHCPPPRDIRLRYPSLPATQLMLGYAIQVIQPAADVEPRLPHGCALALVIRVKNASVSFLYDSKRVADDSIGRIADQFCEVTKALCDPNSHQRVQTLPLLSEQARSEVLMASRGEVRHIPENVNLVELIEDQVLRTPHHDAVRYQGRSLTYEELNGQANRWARYLRSKGADRNRLVGVCAERSLQLVVALLATLKSGAAYVPLDPDLPIRRLSVMAEDSMPCLILTHQRFLNKLKGLNADLTCLDDPAFKSLDPCCSDLNIEIKGSDLAYAIYTSGSTGKPKGVLNIHRGIVNRLLWMQAEYRLGSENRVLQKTPCSFDVSVWEFFWPLLAGATIVMAEPGGHRDPRYLANLIRSEKITTLHFVPPMLQAFLDEEQIGSCPSLTKVFCSGEALPLSVQKRFAECSSAELHNLYGPTEAAVDVTYHHCTATDAATTVPIGRPVWNTQIYILDRQGELTPVGIEGELHIGGVQLALGYLNRPELTGEKFIPDPFANEAGARLYKTGDLCRWASSGVIEYLGRLDHQVKIRGMRIELGEIEHTLGQQPEIKHSVVVVREDHPGQRMLVAYLVLTPGALLDPDELRRRLGRLLPEYMVPSLLVELDRLPLSLNGKVDRKCLPVPQRGADQQARSANAGNATETEKLIAQILSLSLSRESIAPSDDFFELGGHSLLAIRVVALLRREFQVELSLSDLFAHPTPAKLAQLVRSLQVTGSVEAPLDLEPQPRIQPIRLSYAQQRLFFFYRLDPANASFNVPFALEFNGHFDIDCARAALLRIVERHEILRTTYCEDERGPIQIIHANLAPEFVEIALADDTDLRATIAAEAARALELEHGPVVRCSFIRAAEGRHVMLIVLHHISTDGWSLQVLQREFLGFYKSLIAADDFIPGSLSVQYADFAIWQQEWLSGERMLRQAGFWRAQLRGFPTVLQLPTDRPRLGVPNHSCGVECAHIPAELWTAAQQVARRENVTPFMFLLAAFELLMSRHAKAQKVIVGTDLANRFPAETESLIGFFVNVVPVPLDFSDNPTFTESLLRVRRASLGAFAHADIPFDRIVEEIGVDRSASENPLVQVLFVMQNPPFPDMTLPGATVRGYSVDPVGAKFEIAVFAQETGEEIAFEWVYRSDLFDATTVARFARRLETLLGNAVRAPEQRVDKLDHLTAEERAEAEISNAQGKQKKAQMLRSAKRHGAPV